MNTSGITPFLDKVLVKPDVIEEVTPGGIVIPATAIEQQMMAQTSGTLIAVGPEAWTHFYETKEGVDGKTVTKRSYSKPQAKVGDKVMFAKYGGQTVWGKDGEEYRLLLEDDLVAGIEEGVTFNNFQGRKKGGVSKK